MYFLEKKDIQEICFEYAKVHLSYDEPIPSFETHFPDKLETALFSPQKYVGGQRVYSDLAEQAAVLFYEMIKLHPFLNGNKRIACVALMVFLSLNGKWVKTDWRKLYDIAIAVANSNLQNREGMLGLLTAFIRNNLGNL